MSDTVVEKVKEICVVSYECGCVKRMVLESSANPLTEGMTPQCPEHEENISQFYRTGVTEKEEHIPAFAFMQDLFEDYQEDSEEETEETEET